MSLISKNIFSIHQEIHRLARENNRDPHSIHLIVVSKSHSTHEIQEAIAAGETHFGENYIKEALPKIETLRKYPLTWHFIGPIQSNKTKAIATHFDWVHSLDREKMAKRLNDQRPHDKDPLNICVEVNIGNEKTKSGLSLSEVPSLIEKISHYPRLKVRGLMALPPQSHSFEIQCAYFKKLRIAFEELRTLGYSLDALSMGTSQDYSAAITEGATWLRIGRKIMVATTYDITTQGGSQY